MKESDVNNQFVFIQLGPELYDFNKLFNSVDGIILLNILDPKTALIELFGISKDDVLEKFSNVIIEPNILYELYNKTKTSAK